MNEKNRSAVGCRIGFCVLHGLFPEIVAVTEFSNHSVILKRNFNLTLHFSVAARLFLPDGENNESFSVCAFELRFSLTTIIFWLCLAQVISITLYDLFIICDKKQENSVREKFNILKKHPFHKTYLCYSLQKQHRGFLKMKRLWAPWRMEYILKMKQDECFLCEIIKSDDDETNLVLLRGETSLLLMNRYPYNNGHLMVAPYRHVAALEAMNEVELLDMMRLASDACAALRKIVCAEGFNVGLNLGAAAGAGLKDHVHLHIVPRWSGDTNFMPVIADSKVIPQSLDQLCAELRRTL